MNIRIYDNGGKTFDRFTVIFMDEKESQGLYGARGMSEDPFHGFGQYCSAMPGRHLGKRIRFEDLPKPCQQVVMNDLKDA